ncbi:MAG: hypothetical protein ACRECZ_05065 [Methylocella sp.]
MSYTREALVSPASGGRTGGGVAIRVAPNLKGKSALCPDFVHCLAPAPRSIDECHSHIAELHGSAVMVTVMLLGALFSPHIGRAWRTKKNRTTVFQTHDAAFNAARPA